MNSRYRAESILLRLAAVVSLAALSACGSGGSGSADLGGGGSVPQELPTTTTTSFDEAKSDPFVAGSSFYSAQFSGGLATGNGAWIVESGNTAVVNFATPADSVNFEAIPAYEPPAAPAASQKGSIRQPSRAVNSPFGDAPLYVRGGIKNDWAATPETEFTEVADNKLETTFSVDPGAYEFKVADAGYSNVNCGAGDDATIAIGSAYTLVCGSNPPNLNITIAEAGDYKFSLDVSDVEAPTLTITAAGDGGGGGGGGGGGEPRACGLSDQGNDNTVPYGVEIFVRGSVSNDWAAVPETQLFNFGGNLYKAELEVAAGAQQFKVADAGWASVNCGAGDSDTISVGTPFGAVCGSNPPNINFNAPADACYEFAVDVSDQAAPVITITEADLSGGGGGEPEPGFEIRLYDSSGAQIGDTLEGTTEPLAVAVSRIGRETRIARVEIENLGGGDLGIEDFEWTADPRFAPDPAANPIDIYFFAPDGNYDGTTITVDGTTYTCAPVEGGGCVAGGIPAYPYSEVSFVVTRGDGSTQTIRGYPADSQDLYATDGDEVARTGAPDSTPGTVVGAAAHWVLADTLIWSPTNVADPDQRVVSAELLHSPSASIGSTPVVGGDVAAIPLSPTTNPALPNFLNLSTDLAWSLPAGVDAKALLREQLVAVGRNAFGTIVQATRVQTPGALDDVYADAAFDEPLGVSYSGGVPTLRVWAPTALLDPGVSVNLYDEAGTLLDSVPMVYDETTGIWSVTGTSDWDRRFYTISLRVYTYATNGIVDNEVTDPYSISLAADSVRSQFVNLDDADLKPAGWDTLTKPALEAPEDIVVYETHVRDFSIADATVPEEARGKYIAFDTPGTAGRQHLEELQQAGLTHLHLLPVFDIATVRERREDRVEIDDTFDDLCAANASVPADTCTTYAGQVIRDVLAQATDADPNSTLPQEVHGWIRDLDGFNWGYDPWHYGAPEGSYATDPDGVARILEFRRMVKGLADLGLRAVMDVVYNHTNASGQNQKSVLDKVVPGYYHRYDDTTGNILRNSCCDDTATEFRMMEKLMLDTAEIWVRDYKIDGMRVDLMSFHTLESMQALQARGQAINPAFYLYGEGWNFGDVGNDARFVQARQANLGGTGIGSFSDRIRDPIRGGGPFDEGINHVRNQGFISGEFYDPNSENSGSDEEKAALLAGTDNIKVWMAGGLADYPITDASGNIVLGGAVDYAGQDSGYTLDPQEAINYIDKHDNETLWDISQYKHPAGTPTSDRVRAHNVGYSMILLAQGVPFIHAGGDILRSKSMDRNSYDSGDWYNELLWSLDDSKWGKGLPPSGDNANNLPVIPDIVNDPTTEPVTADLQTAFASLREFLEIRKSTQLFRLRTGEQVKSRLRYFNEGPDQIPGVVVQYIDGCISDDLTPEFGGVVTIVNATTTSQTVDLFGSGNWTLHPVQQASADPIVQGASHDANGFSVPARTTAVFVAEEQRPSCAPFPADIFVRGTFNDWANPPDPNYQLEFLGGTEYSATVPATAGSQVFKIADASWTAETNCGGAQPGQVIELAEPVLLTCGDGTENLGIDIPADGDYTFALDATDTVNPTLTVFEAAPFDVDLFIRGDLNGWADPPPPSAQMSYDARGTYRVVIDGLAAQAYNFKVADAGWGGSNGGASNCGAGAQGTATLGEPLPLFCDGSSGNVGITLPEAGSYLFAADFTNPSAPTITVERATFDTSVFVRGSFNGWADPPPAGTRLGELGAGILAVPLRLAAGEVNFKVADATWAIVNCGGGATTLGQPTVLTCDSNSPNTVLTAPADGIYTFTLDANDVNAPVVTVTGP
jgi:pullulanase